MKSYNEEVVSLLQHLARSVGWVLLPLPALHCPLTDVEARFQRGGSHMRPSEQKCLKPWRSLSFPTELWQRLQRHDVLVAEPWVLKNLSLEKLEFSLKATSAREDCIIILNILGGWCSHQVTIIERTGYENCYSLNILWTQHYFC